MFFSYFSTLYKNLKCSNLLVFYRNLNILGVLNTAKLTRGTGIEYAFNQEELNAASNDASNFLK